MPARRPGGLFTIGAACAARMVLPAAWVGGGGMVAERRLVGPTSWSLTVMGTNALTPSEAADVAAYVRTF